MSMEFYGYFDSTESDPRVYSSDELAQVFRTLAGSGVGSGLRVIPGGDMTVKVEPGAAMVYGYTYALMDDGGDDKTLTLSASGSADRIDRIALKLDLSAGGRSLSLEVKQGVPGASPVAPALESTALVKEISLGQVRVPAAASVLTAAHITDERQDPAVCGLLISDQVQAALGQKMGLEAGETLTAAIAQRASTSHYEAVLTTAGWSGTGPYEQSVAVAGILQTDTPFVDVSLAGATTTTQATDLLNAWAMVGRVMTTAGSITAYCYEEKPKAAIPIILKVVR